MGSHDRSADLYTRSIEIRRGHDLAEHIPSVRHRLADVRLDAGDLDASERHYRERSCSPTHRATSGSSSQNQS